MKKRNRFLSVALILCLLLFPVNLFSAFADESPISGDHNEDCVERQVAEIMKDYFLNEEETRRRLEMIDVELIGEPTLVEHETNSMLYAVNPSDFDLLVYSYSRGNSSVVYLQWSIRMNTVEVLNSIWGKPLDCVSLEWDTTYGSYYRSGGDGEYSTVQSRNVGVVLFNVEDYRMDRNDSSYGYVEIMPESDGWLNYGSKYTHTYTVIGLSGSFTTSYAPSAQISADGDFSLGLAYTYGYTVTVSGNIREWQIWNDNATEVRVRR